MHSAEKLCKKCSKCKHCKTVVDQDTENQHQFENFGLNTYVPFVKCPFCASSLCFRCSVKGCNINPSKPIYMCCKKPVVM